MNFIRILWLCVLVGCRSTSTVESDEPSFIAPELVEKNSQIESVEDLVERGNQGFFVQDGAYFGPSLPGWASVSGSDRNGVWQMPERLSAQLGTSPTDTTVSWLSGRAGSLRLPISESYAEEVTLQFWFFGILERQAASLFFDGKQIGTVELSRGWQSYSVPLPKVDKGEHRLRFWFRHVQNRRGVRTPGALGQLRIGSAEPRSEVGMEGVGAASTVLRAVGGSKWQFYLTQLGGAQLELSVEISDGLAEAGILLEDDGGLFQKLGATNVRPGQPKTIRVRIPSELDHPLRLSLYVDGAAKEVVWHRARLTRTIPVVSSQAVLNESRRRIFILLEGVGSSDLRLGRAGLYAVTPTLDKLAQSAVSVPRAFTGGDTMTERIERVLERLSMNPSLNAKARPIGLFSESKVDVSAAIDGRLARRIVLAGEDFGKYLEELETWLSLVKHSDFDLVLVLNSRRSSIYSSDPRMLDEVRANSRNGPTSAARAAKILTLDQKISQILGLLAFTTTLTDTLAVIMGHGAEDAQSVDKLHPDRFFSPVLIWPSSSRVSTLTDLLYPFDTLMARIVNPTTPDKVSEPTWSHSVRQGAKGYTSVLAGSRLLWLQDAQRYGLFVFDKGWLDLGQARPIEQRAMRVLVDY